MLPQVGGKGAMHGMTTEHVYPARTASLVFFLVFFLAGCLILCVILCGDARFGDGAAPLWQHLMLCLLLPSIHLRVKHQCRRSQAAHWLPTCKKLTQGREGCHAPATQHAAPQLAQQDRVIAVLDPSKSSQCNGQARRRAALGGRRAPQPQRLSRSQAAARRARRGPPGPGCCTSPPRWAWTRARSRRRARPAPRAAPPAPAACACRSPAPAGLRARGGASGASTVAAAAALWLWWRAQKAQLLAQDKGGQEGSSSSTGGE